MSNNFTSLLNTIAARAMIVLRKTTVMPRLVNSDFSAEVAQKGATIQIQKGVTQSVFDITPSNTPPSLVDTTPTTANITVDQWKGSSFHLTDKDFTLIEAREGFLPIQAEEAVSSLSKSVNSYILGLYKGIYNYAGTAGTNPFASNANSLIDLDQVLFDNDAPSENRRLVLSSTANAGALKLETLTAEYAVGDNTAKIKGYIGERLGFEWYKDQQVPTHTLGAAGTILIAGAQSAGATNLNVDGVTATAVVGDLFTIAGDTTQYVVTAASGIVSTAQTLTISPALAANASDNAALTFVGNHKVNLAFHRNAFGFALRTAGDSQYNAKTNRTIITVPDAVSGLVLQFEVYDGYKATVFEYSVLYGASLLRAEIAGRLLG